MVRKAGIYCVFVCCSLNANLTDHPHRLYRLVPHVSWPLSSKSSDVSSPRLNRVDRPVCSTIMNSYKPLIHNLPISLAERIEEIQGRPPAPRFSVDGNTGEVLLPEHMEARRDAERAEKAERRSFDFVDASETPVGAGASRDVEYPTKGQLTAVTDEHPSLDRAPTPLGLDGRQGNGTAAGKANQPDRQVNGSPIPLDEVDASGRRHIDHDGLRLDLNAFDPPATYEKARGITCSRLL